MNARLANLAITGAKTLEQSRSIDVGRKSIVDDLLDVDLSSFETSSTVTCSNESNRLSPEYNSSNPNGSTSIPTSTMRIRSPIAAILSLKNLANATHRARSSSIVDSGCSGLECSSSFTTFQRFRGWPLVSSRRVWYSISVGMSWSSRWQIYKPRDIEHDRLRIGSFSTFFPAFFFCASLLLPPPTAND